MRGSNNVKKKTIIGLFLCMSLLATVVGCSKSSTNDTTEKTILQTTAQPNSNSQTSGNANQTPTDKNANDPNSGKGIANLMGQVKSISDGKITLAVAQMPQKDTSTTPKDANPPQNPSAGQANNTEPGQKKMVSPTLTGETKTITIPTSVKIMTGKDNAQEIAIKSLKEGDMLEVWFKDGKIENGTVESVRAMQQSPQQ
jgi:hypothetical protein